MQQIITKQQIVAIVALFVKLGLTEEQQKALLLGFTNNRTCSKRQLYFIEAKEIIRHLKSLDPEEQRCKPMRNKILAMAFTMGYTKKNNAGITVTDVAKLDIWMKHYSYLKKGLYSYTYKELPKLVTQFTNVYNSILKKIK